MITGHAARVANAREDKAAAEVHALRLSMGWTPVDNRGTGRVQPVKRGSSKRRAAVVGRHMEYPVDVPLDFAVSRRGKRT